MLKEFHEIRFRYKNHKTGKYLFGVAWLGLVWLDRNRMTQQMLGVNGTQAKNIDILFYSIVYLLNT